MRPERLSQLNGLAAAIAGRLHGREPDGGRPVTADAISSRTALQNEIEIEIEIEIETRE